MFAPLIGLSAFTLSILFAGAPLPVLLPQAKVVPVQAFATLSPTDRAQVVALSEQELAATVGTHVDIDALLLSLGGSGTVNIQRVTQTNTPENSNQSNVSNVTQRQ